MSTFYCYIFRAKAVLLKSEIFESETAAKRAAASAFFWEDCDHIEVWHEHRKIIEWARDDGTVTRH